MDKHIFKNKLMFFISYFPFVYFFLFPLAVIIIIALSVLEQTYVLKIDMENAFDYMLYAMTSLFFAGLVGSIGLALFYLKKIYNSQDYTKEYKRQCLKLFFKLNIFANSFFYDIFYRDEQKIFFHRILEDSRNKIFKLEKWNATGG